MSITEYKTDQPDRNDNQVLEISLNDVAYFIKNSRLPILIATVIGLLVGTIYAFSKPDMYKAQVTVMPEAQVRGAGGVGGLGSLAGLAGFSLDNLGAQSGEIHPDIYPDILQSSPFAITLLKDSVYSQKLNKKTTLKQFIIDTSEKSFIDRIQDGFYGLIQPADKPSVSKQAVPQIGNVLQTSQEQEWLSWAVRGAVSTVHEKKTGLVTITVTEIDPFVAATIARLSLDYLTNYITSYRTEKARQQVDFLEKQVEVAENRYRDAEYSISSYRDRNRNLYLNTAKISEQRLQANYLLAQSVYNDLAKQLEQGRIKIQEETPVFKVLEPPKVPLWKSGPKRLFIAIGFAIAATTLSIVILLIRQIQRHFSTVIHRKN